VNNKLLILGAGGHGRAVADSAVKMKKWSSISFVDSKYPNFKKTGIWNVVGSDNDLLRLKEEYDTIAIAIGDNQLRLKLLFLVKKIGFSVAKIVDPSAQIGDQVLIGEATVILPNAVIGYGASIGSACIINTAATVDHDCNIDSGVHLSPGVNLGGGVSVGEGSWIGIGASVIHNCIIGRKVIVGAGSVVINNILDNLTVAGLPASQI